MSEANDGTQPKAAMKPVVQLTLPLQPPRPTRDQRRAVGEAWLKILYALLTPVGEQLPRSGDTGGAPCSTK